jgi:hypothetical protein
MLIAVPVALLITWRLLSGSAKHHRDEQRAANQLDESMPAYQGTSQQFAARTLRICTKPCKAAVVLREVSFLEDDVPDLPLAACDRPQACHCAYAEHRDRRVKAERRYPAADLVPTVDLVPMDATDTAIDQRGTRDRRRRGKRRPASVYDRG